MISKEAFVKKCKEINVRNSSIINFYNSSKTMIVLSLSESASFFRLVSDRISREIQWHILIKVLKRKIRLFSNNGHNANFMMTILKEGEIRRVDIDADYKRQLEEQCKELLGKGKFKFWQDIEKRIHDKMSKNPYLALEYILRERIELLKVLLNFNGKKDGQWLDEKADQFNEIVEKKVKGTGLERKSWFFAGGTDNKISELIRTFNKKMKKQK